MGFFSVAQGLAGLGSNLGTASQIEGERQRTVEQDALAKKLQDLRSQQEERRLKMEETSAAQKTPEGIRALLSGVLGREPNEDELQRYMGISPKEEKVGINREGLIRQMTMMAQDPEATPQQKKVWNSLIMQALSTPPADINGLQRLSDFSDRLMEQWSKPQTEKAPITKDFGGFVMQYDPENKIKGVRGGPGNQWVRLGPQKTGAENTPLDNMVYGLASGQINKWPTGKLLAQVLNRAKELEVTLPNQPGSNVKPPLGAAVALNNYRKLERNLAQAEFIAGQNLTPETSQALAKLAGEADPKSEKWFGFFGGNPRAFTPKEAQSAVADIRRAKEEAQSQLKQIYEESNVPFPAEFVSEPTQLPGVKAIGK